MSSFPADPTRRCAVCGEPIYSRDHVHPECAERGGEQQRSKAPQKACAKCGEKTHVRTLVCKHCGAMF